MRKVAISIVLACVASSTQAAWVEIPTTMWNFSGYSQGACTEDSRGKCWFAVFDRYLNRMVGPQQMYGGTRVWLPDNDNQLIVIGKVQENACPGGNRVWLGAVGRRAGQSYRPVAVKERMGLTQWHRDNLQAAPVITDRYQTKWYNVLEFYSQLNKGGTFGIFKWLGAQTLTEGGARTVAMNHAAPGSRCGDHECIITLFTPPVDPASGYRGRQFQDSVWVHYDTEYGMTSSGVSYVGCPALGYSSQDNVQTAAGLSFTDPSLCSYACAPFMTFADNVSYD